MTEEIKFHSFALLFFYIKRPSPHSIHHQQPPYRTTSPKRKIDILGDCKVYTSYIVGFFSTVYLMLVLEWWTVFLSKVSPSSAFYWVWFLMKVLREIVLRWRFVWFWGRLFRMGGYAQPQWSRELERCQRHSHCSKSTYIELLLSTLTTSSRFLKEY